MLRGERMKDREINPSVIYLFNIYMLKKAGYPFGANDLDISTWLKLNDVENAITEHHNEEIAKKESKAKR